MRPRLLLAPTALALAACTLGPSYQRPTTPVPQAWRDSATVQATSVADEPWWQVFPDAVLQQLVRTALARNTDLRGSIERVTEATARLRYARGLLLPAAYAYASASYTGSSSEGTDYQSDRLAAEAVVSWDADVFGFHRSLVARSREQLLASEEARRDVTLLTVTTVAAAYFELGAADGQLDVARRTVESRQRFVAITRQRVERGIADEIDHRQALALHESARTLAIGLQEAIAQIEHALSALLGSPPGPIPRGTPLAKQTFPSDIPVGLPSLLLERRPDVRRAEHRLAATLADVGAAKAELFPRLVLNGGLSYARTTTEASGSGFPFGPRSDTRDDRRWGVTAAVSQPIYVGGRNRADIRASESVARQAVIDYEETVLAALRQAEDALVAVRLVAERRASVDSLVVHSGAVLERAEVRYEGGTTPFLEVLDAQRELLRAEISAVLARRDQAAAFVALYRALGGGWQADSTDGSPSR